jgi:hypothetical protein
MAAMAREKADKMLEARKRHYEVRQQPTDSFPAGPCVKEELLLIDHNRLGVEAGGSSSSAHGVKAREVVQTSRSTGPQLSIQKRGQGDDGPIAG